MVVNNVLTQGSVDRHHSRRIQTYTSPVNTFGRGPNTNTQQHTPTHAWHVMPYRTLKSADYMPVLFAAA